MPSLRLESANDALDLSDVERNGYGIQVLSGVTGLGLAPVAAQWIEGAGDGAIYRGRRILARDLDLPLLIQGRTRNELSSFMSRLALMLSDVCTLRFEEERGVEWSTDVVQVGGGDYTYGHDTTGSTDCLLVVTMRAGDPYFTSNIETSQIVGTSNSVRGLLGGGSLSDLSLASSQVLGSVTLHNDGTADAFPVWTLTGPGTDFIAISPRGETLRWTGTLSLGQTLTIDTRKGTVVDQSGANRYDLLAPSPRFWSIPPGDSVAQVTMTGTTPGTSQVRVAWRARKRLVI